MAKTTKPNYNVDGKPGLARTVVSRTSGTRINIWFTPEAKQIKTNDAKPWVVECEDHKAQRNCVTRTEARQHREDPASFCTKCKAASKSKTKAPAKTVAPKATPIKKAAPAKRAAQSKKAA
jgi:hypothetical protein